MFAFRKSNTHPVAPIIKTLPSKASTTYKLGDAVILSGGVLEKATGGTKPEYICACNYAAPAEDMEPIAVYLISPGSEWDTTFSAAATSIDEGDVVTINTDAAQVTATATGGVAKILKKHGTGASGEGVTVTFVDPAASGS